MSIYKMNLKDFKNSQIVWLIVAFLLGYFARQICSGSGSGKVVEGQVNAGKCVVDTTGATFTKLIRDSGGTIDEDTGVAQMKPFCDTLNKCEGSSDCCGDDAKAQDMCTWKASGGKCMPSGTKFEGLKKNPGFGALATTSAGEEPFEWVCGGTNKCADTTVGECCYGETLVRDDMCTWKPGK